MNTKFAKVTKATYPKRGIVLFHLNRVDNGRLISVFSDKAEALAKRDAINAFRATLNK